MVTTTRFIFLLILCALLTVSSVSAAPSLYYDDATSITRIGSGDLYFSSGDECVFAGVLTTNDSITVDSTTDIVIHKRNKQISIIDDLMGFMYWILDTMGYTIIVIIAGVIIGVRILGIAVQVSKGI